MPRGAKMLVLASRSPRRAMLLRMIGADFMVVEPSVSEEVRGDPVETVLYNAERKALSVLGRAPDGSIVIGADTIVAGDDGAVYGKPRSLGEAASFLRRLSGRWHTVYTGVALVDKDTGGSRVFYEATRVRFKELSDHEVRLYLASMEPLGKAGGYAIQGIASLLIEEIRGDYYNVVGLPLHKLYVALLSMGYDLLEKAVEGRVLRARL